MFIFTKRLYSSYHPPSRQLVSAMWRESIHRWLVKQFLASPRFHQVVRMLNGEGYTAAHAPDLAAMLRLKHQQKLIRKRKRDKFWQFFKEELWHEIVPRKK